MFFVKKSLQENIDFPFFSFYLLEKCGTQISDKTACLIIESPSVSRPFASCSTFKTTEKFIHFFANNFGVYIFDNCYVYHSLRVGTQVNEIIESAIDIYAMRPKMAHLSCHL